MTSTLKAHPTEPLMMLSIRLNFFCGIWIDGCIEKFRYIFPLIIFTFCREKTSFSRSNLPKEQPASIKCVFPYVRLSYSCMNTNHKQVEFFHTNSGLLLKEVKKLTSFFHFWLLYLCFLWEKPSLCRIYLIIGSDGR